MHVIELSRRECGRKVPGDDACENRRLEFGQNVHGDHLPICGQGLGHRFRATEHLEATHFERSGD